VRFGHGPQLLELAGLGRVTNLVSGLTTQQPWAFILERDSFSPDSYLPIEFLGRHRKCSHNRLTTYERMAALDDLVVGEDAAVGQGPEQDAQLRRCLVVAQRLRNRGHGRDNTWIPRRSGYRWGFVWTSYRKEFGDAEPLGERYLA